MPEQSEGAVDAADRNYAREAQDDARKLHEIVLAIDGMDQSQSLQAKRELLEISTKLRGCYKVYTECRRLRRRNKELRDSSAQRVHAWAEIEAITDAPDVHEALQAFSEDPSGDHGVFVVEAVLKALGLKTSPWKEGMPIPTVRISVEDGKPAFTHLNGEPLGLTADELKVCEEAGKSVKPLEPWQHHAKKLVEWRNCMSYNDSYFGEPAGLLKQVVAELERLMPPHPVKAAEAKEGGAA